MDKKAINEIRKLFDKNDCRVDRMYGCYVNEQKERIADLKDSFHSLQDEELFKYCEIFKKAGMQVNVVPVTTAEYGVSKARRPFNSRLDKEKLTRKGFERLPSWSDALERYLKMISAGGNMV